MGQREKLLDPKRHRHLATKWQGARFSHARAEKWKGRLASDRMCRTIGAARSITSNLHGGGIAVEMGKLLRERFREEKKIATIRETSKRLAMDIVAQLEQEYGRLCELALDLAIDPDGGVWLLEINPKPGRNIFLQIQDLPAYRTAVSSPLEYAKWLHKQKST